MYEITLNAEEYGLEALAEGLGGAPVLFNADERAKWASEIGKFALKLEELKGKAINLQGLLQSEDTITATPVSLKTLKVRMFQINDALNSSLEMAESLEKQIVTK
jgi:hypothetical protein